jgi:hypothetical protein
MSNKMQQQYLDFIAGSLYMFQALSIPPSAVQLQLTATGTTCYVGSEHCGRVRLKMFKSGRWSNHYGVK